MFKVHLNLHYISVVFIYIVSPADFVIILLALSLNKDIQQEDLNVQFNE